MRRGVGVGEERGRPNPARARFFGDGEGGVATPAGGCGEGRVVTPCWPVSGDEAEQRGVLVSIVMTGVVCGAGALLGCHVMSLSATTTAPLPPPPCCSLRHAQFLSGQAFGRPATHVHLNKDYMILKKSCRRRGTVEQAGGRRPRSCGEGRSSSGLTYMRR